ncbi:nucleotidyltransferase domain-containing protein [Desulfovermiculus halophilus]|jgi:predicted nucleotidyltransferase|uniref:nucleotidyltransferase domain-containing protein n=1 Tax=Desulfovermiculus halophilus TaxID=339722 RepID=UPI0005506AF3|nr:nucleotidyltransferase domain-containing protein [Desulfovermiculus halophilus]
MPEVEEAVRSFVALLRKDKRISGAYIYGSYAKGTANKWSDIDLAVISPDFSEDLFQERIALMKLALRVDDRIEPSPFRPEDFTMNNPLVNEIHLSGIEVH